MKRDAIWPSVDDETSKCAVSNELDVAEIKSAFQGNAPDLFVAEQSLVQIMAAVIDNDGTVTRALGSDGELEKFLEAHGDNVTGAGELEVVRETPEKDCFEFESASIDEWRHGNSPKAQFFILGPGYGWGRLLITKESMARLLATYSVFPGLWKYLTAFGLKDFAKDEGFAGYDTTMVLDADGSLKSFESSYLLKYVQEKNPSPTSSTANPWSLRHALIYQKYHFKTQQSNNIFVRLSRKMEDRLCQVVKGEHSHALKFIGHWTSIHMTCLSTVADSWRHYINYLDQEISTLFDRVRISALDPLKLKEIDSLQHYSRDMKRLHYMIDQALRTSHMIDLNIDVMRYMIETSQKLQKLDSDTHTNTAYSLFQERIQTTIQDHGFHRKAALSLIERGQVLSNQLRDTIALRNSEVNKLNAGSSNKSTLAILDLSEKSNQEARIMKTLTIVAIIFVPASFVAVLQPLIPLSKALLSSQHRLANYLPRNKDFLQMGYVSVIQGTDFTLAASRDLWIYALLAIPLIIAILLIYAIIEIRNRRKLKRNSEDIQCLV